MRKKFLHWRLWAAQLWKKEHEVFTAFLEFSRKKQVISYYLSPFSIPYTFSGIVAKEWTREVFSEQYFTPILIFRCWPHFVNSDNTTEKMQDWSTRGAKEKFQKSDNTKPFPFLLSTNETSRRRINFFSKIQHKVLPISHKSTYETSLRSINQLHVLPVEATGISSIPCKDVTFKNNKEYGK